MKLFKIKADDPISKSVRYIQPDLVQCLKTQEYDKGEFDQRNHHLIFYFGKEEQFTFCAETRGEVMQVLNDYLEHIEKYS